MKLKAKLIWETWIKHLQNKPESDAIIHYSFDENPYKWSYKSLIESAIRITVYLRQQGVKRGDVCAIIIRHNKYFYPIYFGASLLGAITTVLAYQNPKLHPDKFIFGLEGMSKKSGLDWILTENELEDIIKPIVTKTGSTVRKIFCPLNIFIDNPTSQVDLFTELNALKKEWKEIKSTDPFLLQHSSGTTGLQKGVTLSHKSILKHAEFYGDAIELTENDKIVSWLPLYHDMGLIAAFIIPFIRGITSIQIDPFDWVLDPVILMNVIADQKGTLVWLPNFAYNVLAEKVHADDLKGNDLSSVRMLINCSEQVRYDAHEKLFAFYRKYGIKRKCLSACYAMAETTFAVTQTNPGKQAKVLYVDRNKLAYGKIEVLDRKSDKQAQILVSSGKPIRGCSIKIVSSNGSELPDNFIGEIIIKSVSLFDGYKNNPEKSKEVLKNGWFFSGDLGFTHDGECYVIGRNKDIIIVAGKNIYPEDIESIINKVDNVIPGRVVAFGMYDTDLGTDQIHVIVETNIPLNEYKQLSQLIIKILQEYELFIAKVHVKPPRWLIKSSSGKLSRNDNKERILNEIT